METEVNILIVDDVEENIISLKDMIEDKDRNIYTATNGTEALRMNQNYDFDLIMCDVRMPEMDGFKFLNLLRLNPDKKNIPFIFITAYDKERQFEHKGYTGGAVDYLVKPLDVDITRAKVDVFVELARKKNELKSKNEELQDLYKMKRDFMETLAIDMRGPLSMIQLYTEFLQINLEGKITEDLIYLLESNHQSAVYLNRSLNNLLDILNLGAGKIELKLENVDVKSFVESIVLTNKIIGLKKNISLKLNFKGEIPKCLIDESKIRQVLNNLILNAIQFSKEDSFVYITVSAKEDNLLFEVIDEGKGISIEELDNLFKPLKKNMGLYICWKIIEYHKGKIGMEFGIEKGSKFYFDIPIWRDQR